MGRVFSGREGGARELKRDTFVKECKVLWEKCINFN